MFRDEGINFNTFHLKSHTEAELAEALRVGASIYELSTGSPDTDDVLVGDWQECWESVCDFHGFLYLPEGWDLKRLN